MYGHILESKKSLMYDTGLIVWTSDFVFYHLVPKCMLFHITFSSKGRESNNNMNRETSINFYVFCVQEVFYTIVQIIKVYVMTNFLW